MLETGRTWVKISGIDIASVDGPPYDDAKVLSDWLVGVAPDRLVWGSDWPHVDKKGTPVANDGDLLNTLAANLGSEALLRQILVDNPAALYGFSGD